MNQLVRIAALILLFSQVACKANGSSGGGNGVDPDNYEFTDSATYSFSGNGSLYDIFALSLPATTAPSIFSFTNSAIEVAANKDEDDSSGLESPTDIAVTTGVSYTTAVFLTRSSRRKEIITKNDATDNLELISLERSSADNAVSYTKETTLASQVSDLASIAMTADGEYLLFASASTNIHKIIKRSFDDDGELLDTFTVTVSSVGTTISNAVKALSANLNNSSDTGGDRNEYEFLLVGQDTIRILTPDGDGLYTDSASITRSGDAEIVDAELVRWDGDAFPDLLILTEDGLEYYKNTSEQGGDISFSSTAASLSTVGIDFGIPNKFIAQDLNGDDYQDLIVFRTDDDPLYLQFTGDLSLSDRSSRAFGTALENTFIDAVVADVNSDDLSDIGFVDADGNLTMFLAGQ